MILHGASCLEGPITRQRTWWQEANIEPVNPAAHQEEHNEEGIRPALVARVRKAIAEGTYDTPEKWEAALDRLLDEVMG